MTPELTLTPVRVGTGTEDEEGQLVFAGDRLVAVLVQLAERHEAEGHWFLEHGFGRLDVPVPPTFPDLPAAEAWISAKLSGGATSHATLPQGQMPFSAPHAPR